MKKVLILTCSTGEGHNSAAHAIESALLKRNDICELVDPVMFQSERMTHVVSSLYNNTIKKAPKVFGVVYKLGDMYSSTKLTSPVYWANAQYADNLKAYILQNGFDAVICTHLYGMEAMTAIRKDQTFSVPCYGVLTDYTCIPFIDETELTGYFVPHEEAKEFLVKRGIPAENITVSGIPVHEKFRQHEDRFTARKKLNIPQDKKVFLVMTGGIGCENMEGLCDAFLSSMNDDSFLIVMTGKNDELKMRLDNKYETNSQIRTIPFTKEVAAYMAASDVMLSKPGGLSSTEAAVANIPLIHIHAIPGCETCNEDFFADHGMSFAAINENEAITYANTLVHNEKIADEIRRMQRKYMHPYAADEIAEKVCGA